MNEPTQDEWKEFHQMIIDSKAMLCKTPEGQYTQSSIEQAKWGVQNALDWLNAVRGSYRMAQP